MALACHWMCEPEEKGKSPLGSGTNIMLTKMVLPGKAEQLLTKRLCFRKAYDYADEVALPVKAREEDAK